MKLDQGGEVSSSAIVADYEQAYQAVMAAVIAHDWGGTEPYFDSLTVSMKLPGVEQALPCGQETISTTEAMHRSEEHTSELQSLMRISSAVFCLKKKKNTTQHNYN